MNEARIGHSVVSLPNGEIMVLGGFNGQRTLNSVEILDHTTL